MWVSDKVQHKSACIVTEAGLKLEILDISRRGIYQCIEYKSTDQLCSFCTADLSLCFHICRLMVFSCGGSFHFNSSFIIHEYIYFFTCFFVTLLLF